MIPDWAGILLLLVVMSPAIVAIHFLFKEADNIWEALLILLCAIIFGAACAFSVASDSIRRLLL